MTMIGLTGGCLGGHLTAASPGQTHLYLLGPAGQRLVYRIVRSGGVLVGQLTPGIDAGETCPRCYGDLALYTACPQDSCDEGDPEGCGHSWHAEDLDPVLCLRCDYRTSVAADEEEAWIREENEK